MKKLSVLSLAVLAMISCSSTYKKLASEKVELTSMNDSINFYLGYVNGFQTKSYQLANDSSDKTIAEFVDALKRGYEGKVEELDEVSKAGQNLGQAIKSFETKGLVEQSAWKLNEKILFQGFVNGLLKDTTMMMPDQAMKLFQEQYQLVMSQQNEGEVKVEKAVTAKCGNKAGQIELKNLNDSLNYAFGLMNGGDFANYLLANDSTGEAFDNLIKAINEGLKSGYNNPQLVAMGEQIGQQIKEREPNGLVGVPELTTDFDLIVSGFVKGLYQDTTQCTMQSASEYLDKSISDIKYGKSKQESEAFLKQNALREGVITTESGLQYEVIKMGNGAKPKATDTVKVHYHGTLINGTVFDSSVDRGEPISFPLNGVIAGWTEGLQLMPIGSKFKFYIPQELGYGERAAGSIPPYSTLIFEVELLDIEK